MKNIITSILLLIIFTAKGQPVTVTATDTAFWKSSLRSLQDQRRKDSLRIATQITNLLLANANQAKFNTATGNDIKSITTQMLQVSPAYINNGALSIIIPPLPDIAPLTARLDLLDSIYIGINTRLGTAESKYSTIAGLQETLNTALEARKQSDAIIEKLKQRLDNLRAATTIISE